MKFQYFEFIQETPPGGDFTALDYLNSIGRQGWEVVTVRDEFVRVETLAGGRGEAQNYKFIVLARRAYRRDANTEGEGSAFLLPQEIVKP